MALPSWKANTVKQRDYIKLRPPICAVAIFLMIICQYAYTDYTVALPQDIEVQLLAIHGANYAYSYTRSGNEDGTLICINDQIYGPFGRVDHLSWSPDGKAIAYAAADVVGQSRGGSFYVNHKPHGDFSQIWHYQWSPQGDNFAVFGIEEFKFVVYHNDSRYVVPCPMPIQPGEGVRNIKWTSDGQVLFFLFTTYSSASIYKNGEPIISYDRISNIDLSPVDNTLAYGARDGGKWYLFLGSEKQGPFSGVHSVAWSPDGKTVAYCRIDTQGNKEIVVGEESLGSFASRSDPLIYPQWSPDGEKLTFRYVNNDVGQHLYLADGRIGPYLEIKHNISYWSPDSAMLGYIAKNYDDAWMLFIGDEWFGPLEADFGYNSSFAWSPDGKFVAFTSYSIDKSVLFINDLPILEHGDALSGVGWSSDSRYVSYRKYSPKNNMSLNMIYIDGKEFVGSVFGSQIGYIANGVITVR